MSELGFWKLATAHPEHGALVTPEGQRITAGELYDLFVATVRKEIKPRMGVFDCRMIATFRVQEEPLRGFVDRMKAMEGKGGVLAVSLCHGFPYGRTPLRRLASVTGTLWYGGEYGLAKTASRTAAKRVPAY